MSQLAILLDVPENSLSASGQAVLGIAEDVARQLRNQLPSEAPPDKQHNFTFSTTTTDSDPGAHTLRFNHAAPAISASFTSIFIDDADSAGSDIVAELTRLGAVPGDVKGRLHIANSAEPGNFARFDVTSVVDASGYSKLVGTLKSFGQTSTQTNPNLIFANAADLLVTLKAANLTRKTSSVNAVYSASALYVSESAAPTITCAIVAGAAAGDVTVAGITAGKTLDAVYALTQPVGKMSRFVGDSSSAPHTFATTPVAGSHLETTDIVDAVLIDNTASTHLDFLPHITPTPPSQDHIEQFDGAGVNNLLVAISHHAVSTAKTDLTSEFTAASGKINNTGGTSTLGKTVVVVWH